MTRKEKIVTEAVDEIAGLYDGPPHGGYEKVRAVIEDAIAEVISDYETKGG